MHTEDRRSRAGSLAKWIGAACVVVTLAAVPALAQDKPLKITFVSPLGPGSQFMLPIIKGFETATQQLGIEGTFRGNQEGSDFAKAPAVKLMLENAIATKPDAIIVADQYPDVLNDTIKQAVAAGIPVVLTNGGFGEQDNVGALAFVGTDEHEMGEIGASKLRDLGAKNVMVITVPPGIPLIDQRMEGIAKGIAPAKTTIVQVPLETLFDATKLVNTMMAALQKDPTIDGVFSLGNCCGPAMVTVREQLGDRATSMHFGTIDLGGPVTDALIKGKVDFAIDQQQFLEGYMPVVMLTNYLRYGIVPTDHFFRTGPALITKANAAKISDLGAKNFR